MLQTGYVSPLVTLVALAKLVGTPSLIKWHSLNGTHEESNFMIRMNFRKELAIAWAADVILPLFILHKRSITRGLIIFFKLKLSVSKVPTLHALTDQRIHVSNEKSTNPNPNPNCPLFLFQKFHYFLLFTPTPLFRFNCQHV